MTNFRIYCDDTQFPEENVRALEKAMDGFVKTDVSLAVEFMFVDGEEIRRLNRETRDVDKVTDVLSYPALDGIKGQPLKGAEHPYEIDEEGNLLVGSIVVCCDRAKEQAEEFGHSTFGGAGEAARQAGARRLWLTHYSAMIGDPQEHLHQAQAYYPDAVCGIDGMSEMLLFDK